MRPVEIPFPGGSVSGYDPGEVALATEAAKQELLARLGTDDLVALQAWVEASYPDPGEDLQLIHLKSQTLATTESTTTFFEKISRLLGRLKKIESLMVQLKLAVTPGEAVVELWPAALPARTRKYRAGDAPRISLGLYKYRVAQAGFWDLEGEIDLVSDIGDTLDCKLYPRTDPERQSPCDLR